MIEHEPTIIQCLEFDRREWLSCLRNADQEPRGEGQELGQDAPVLTVISVKRSPRQSVKSRKITAFTFHCRHRPAAISWEWFHDR